MLIWQGAKYFEVYLQSYLPFFFSFLSCTFVFELSRKIYTLGLKSCCCCFCLVSFSFDPLSFFLSCPVFVSVDIKLTPAIYVFRSKNQKTKQQTNKTNPNKHTNKQNVDSDRDTSFTARKTRFVVKGKNVSSYTTTSPTYISARLFEVDQDFWARRGWCSVTQVLRTRTAGVFRAAGVFPMREYDV